MEIIDITLVPILIAFVEAVKKMGLPSKWSPAVAIVLGIGVNLIFSVIGEGITQQIFFGLMAGLAASGLYDFGKTTVLGK